MTPTDRQRRAETWCLRSVALGTAALLVVAVWWPLVALVVGYVALVGVAVAAASAFRV